MSIKQNNLSFDETLKLVKTRANVCLQKTQLDKAVYRT